MPRCSGARGSGCISRLCSCARRAFPRWWRRSPRWWRGTAPPRARTRPLSATGSGPASGRSRARRMRKRSRTCAGPGRADDAAGDAGTPPAGAGPPGGAGPGVAGHPGVCRPRGGTRLRPGPGAVCAARRHAAALPGAAGVDVVLSEPRGRTDGDPTRGAVAPPGPGPARPGAPPARPLSAGEQSCSGGASRPRPGPITRRPWRSMTRRRTGPGGALRRGPRRGRLAALWPGSCGPWALLTRPLQHSQAACTLAEEVAHPIAWRRRWSLRPKCISGAARYWRCTSRQQPP